MSAQPEAPAFSVEGPAAVGPRASFTLKVSGLGEGATVVRVTETAPTTDAADMVHEERTLQGDGELSLTLGRSGRRVLVVEASGSEVEHVVHVLPGPITLVPPILAILMALLFRQVVLALFGGVWIGATMLSAYDPLAGAARALDQFAVGAVADSSHASIVIFSLALGGMIGVLTASGGAAGLANLATRRATTAARGQVATWLLGIAIFFDDYANSLLVGSSMRPITDKLRISREKLAFLVDATAAPVSSIALVSSWIGVEVAYIGEQLRARNIDLDPFSAFVQTLPYRFYPWLMLVFGLAVVLLGRDFGPMRKAEVRARLTGAVLREGARPASNFEGELSDAPPRPWLALGPILTVIAVALGGMWITGRASTDAAEPTLGQIFGAADSLKALLWAAVAGGVVAVALAVFVKNAPSGEALEGYRDASESPSKRSAMTLASALDAWFDGAKSMLLACVILVLAWSLGSVCEQLNTAGVLIEAIGDALNPALLPAIVFIVAAAVSFATGTSWGTMAILFPLVVPLADELAPGQMHILLGAISSILAGSVFGDHCSPISDTTIMSSMASSCDHIDHVRTQLPYALAVGAVAIVIGELGTGFGLYPAWVGLLLGAVAVVAVVRFVGKPVEAVDGADG
ncbi:MAG: Na+/H+ antiporter NhaC family protein [Myxococcota bacterium]